LENFLNEVGITRVEHELHSGFVLTPETWMAIIGAFIGVGLTALVYTRYTDRLGQPLALLRHQFYVNEIYDWIFVKPLKTLARAIVQFFEPKVFEGFITGTIHLTQGTAQRLQLVQSGQIRSYVAWMVLGSVVLILYFLL
jgi:NADH-quinone oxidoreductase subunit L